MVPFLVLNSAWHWRNILFFDRKQDDDGAAMPTKWYEDRPVLEGVILWKDLYLLRCLLFQLSEHFAYVKKNSIHIVYFEL